MTGPALLLLLALQSPEAFAEKAEGLRRRGDAAGAGPGRSGTGSRGRAGGDGGATAVDGAAGPGAPGGAGLGPDKFLEAEAGLAKELEGALAGSGAAGRPRRQEAEEGLRHALERPLAPSRHAAALLLRIVREELEICGGCRGRHEAGPCSAESVLHFLLLCIKELILCSSDRGRYGRLRGPVASGRRVSPLYSLAGLCSGDAPP